MGDVAAADMDAELWTQDQGAADRYNLNHIRSLSRVNLSQQDGVIHQGSNSGFQAINLAYLEGATTVLLLGYDMKLGNSSHWFGSHPAKLERASPYDKFIDAFESIDVPDLEIINCSRDTALTCFPRMSIDEALNAAH